MSTRSMICIERSKNKYDSIYCHSDGYLTYNGAMLLDHYSDKEKLEKLIKLGNISCLNVNVDPDPSKPHSFDYSQRQDDVVVAYGRDRGEEQQESKIRTMAQLTDKDSWIEYVYIFGKDNKWRYMKLPNTILQDVEDGLEREYKRLEIKRPKNYYGFWTDESLKRERKKQNRKLVQEVM